MSTFVLTGFSDEIAPDLREQMEGLRALGISHMEIRGVDGRPITSYDIPGVRRIRRRA